MKLHRIIPFCLFLRLLFIPLPSSGESIIPREEIKTLINSITRAELERHLQMLSGESSFVLNGVTGTIHSRNILHPDIGLAVKYITNHLENLGLEVEAYPFPVTVEGQTLMVENLLARIPGNTLPGQIYLLSGHYDSTASFSDGYNPGTDPAPGADDNGTAISVLLTLAGALSQLTLETSVGFLFVTGEEYGLLGSRYQAEYSAQHGENILGVINMDMLGPDPEAQADTLYAIYGDHAGESVFDPEPLARAFYEVTSAYALPLVFEPYYGPVLLNSDHFPFWYWGYPAIFLGHVNSSKQYHQFDDTIDSVDLDYLEASARIIGAAAAHLASPEPVATEKSGGCQAVPEGGGENLIFFLFPLIVIVFFRMKKSFTKSQAEACGYQSGSYILLGYFGFHSAIPPDRKPYRAGGRIPQSVYPERNRGALRFKTEACGYPSPLPRVAPESCSGERIKMRGENLFWTFMIFLVLGTISCSGGNQTDSLVTQGKSALSQSDPTAAREAFQEVLSDHPDNPDAQFGLVLADLMSFWNSVNLALSEIFRVYISSAETSTQAYANEDEAISAFIQKFITDTETTFAGIAERLDRIGKDQDFAFRIESLPVRSLYNQSRSIKVEFDQTDLCLLSGFSRLMAYLFEFLDAFDLEGRYGQAADLYFQPSSGYGQAFEILNILVFLLNDPGHPNFLGLKPGTGANTLTQSGQTLARAYDDFAKMIESVQAEADNRTDDFLVVKAENNREYLAFGGTEISRTSESTHILDLKIELRPEILASLETTSENLKTGAGSVSLKNDLFYLIDPMVRALALIAGMNIPAIFANVHFSTLVPDVIELNLGRFYSHPAGLRQLLPPWSNTGDILTDNFLLEWECPTNLHPQTGFPISSSGLTCPSPGSVSDSAHFQSFSAQGVAAITADEIKSVFPYIPFPDPTFNGLLYLNPEPLGISSLNGWNEFKPADNLSLNAVLASLLGPILELFQ